MKLFIISLLSLGLTGCALFNKKPPANPGVIAPTVQTDKVDKKVTDAIDELLKQQESLKTLEERITFAKKIAEEIDALTKTTDEDYLTGPTPSNN